MDDALYKQFAAEIDAKRDDKVVRAKFEHSAAMEHLDALRKMLNGSTTPPIAGAIVASKPERTGTSELEFTSLSDGIFMAIAQLNDGFSKSSIVKWINENHPKLNPFERRDSISSLVSRMASNGLIETIRKGKRGEEATYKKSSEFMDAVKEAEAREARG